MVSQMSICPGSYLVSIINVGESTVVLGATDPLLAAANIAYRDIKKESASDKSFTLLAFSSEEKTLYFSLL